MLKIGNFTQINPKQKYNTTYTAYLLKNNILKIGYTRFWLYYGSDLYTISKNKITAKHTYIDANGQQQQKLFVWKIKK